MLVKIISHPAIALLSVALLLVAGPSVIMPYGIPFVMNLLDGFYPSMIGAVGLVLLLVAAFIHKWSTRALLNILGILIVQVSVILFLMQLPEENNYPTYHGLPLMSLILAGICTVAFLLKNCNQLLSGTKSI